MYSIRSESFKKEKLYANLHTHSTHSDGVYSPEELAKIAKEEGYMALAISDHDAATAYPELKRACDELGIESIFAVEFSVKKPYDFHIVAFEFDPEYPEMKKYLEYQGYAQTYNTKMCFEEALGNGNIKGITWDEILEYNKGIIWLCNNHVFRAMKAKGLIEENQYMEWFDTNFKTQRGKYDIKDRFLDLNGIVELIHKAGGIAVCAHPSKEHIENFKLLQDAGIDGLEIIHARMDDETRNKALKLCIENNLYISGGSDHCGLCGGFYDSYPDYESLKKSYHYKAPLSLGAYEVNFREIKTRTINKEAREKIEFNS